ncbi:MAG: hypothetical protein AB8G77_15115 [Rhodothermales bacterium]
MKVFSTCLVMLLFISTNSYGQDGEGLKAKKFENAEWYIQTYYKLDLMKADSAALVLKNHLIPATRKAGYEVNVFQLATGGWQFMLQFRVDGPDALGWEVPQFTVDTMKYLNEQEGGSKALPYWGGAILEYKTEMVMKRTW